MKKLFLALNILLLIAFTKKADALLPPDMIMTIGTSILSVMSIIFVLLSTITFSFFQIIKTFWYELTRRLKIWHYALGLLVLIFLSFIIASSIIK